MKINEGKIRTIVTAIGKRAGLLVVVLVSIGVGFLLHAALTTGGGEGMGAGTEASASQAAPELWICSMNGQHPYYSSPRPGKCGYCGMDLVRAERTTDTRSLREFSTSEAAKALMDIETSRVERKFVAADVRMVGKVDYDETKLAYISAWVPGRLDKLYVNYTGVPVKKGDHLIYIYSPELLSAQEELIQAKQAVKAIQQSDSSLMRETTQAMYQATREKLRLLGLSEEQVAKVERTGKASDHLKIYSPMAGIVIHKNATEGMYVNTGTRIYTVADLSQMWIRLEAYESDLMWLRYGQKIEFTTVAYPGEVFRGMISFIDPVLDPATRTVKVRVNVPNPDGKLKPGMFVKAVVRSLVAADGKVMDADLAGKWISPMHPEIIKDKPGKCDVCGMDLVRTESLGYVSVDPRKADKPLVIPASAPLVTGTRAIVYVEVPRRDKPTYEGREVVLGPRAGNYYLVRAGLAEGDVVVTRGNFKIDSALQISAKPSMMSPEGGGAGGEHAHHGGQPATRPGAEDEKPPMALPQLFVHQVHQVLVAAGAANGAVSAGRTTDEIHAAFEKFGALLKVVDAKGLQGHPAMVWREYAMRLSNDAAEGQQVKTRKDFARVVQSLRQNTKALRTKLALAHDHTAPKARGSDTPTSRPASQPSKTWTCSMHPQIRLSKPGKCPICAMELIPMQADDEGHGHE